MKKMISRRNFLKVAGAGAAAMGLAACGGSSSSSSSVAASSTAANAAGDTLSGTIEYWSSWSETENQALVLNFDDPVVDLILTLSLSCILPCKSILPSTAVITATSSFPQLKQAPRSI